MKYNKIFLAIGLIILLTNCSNCSSTQVINSDEILINEGTTEPQNTMEAFVTPINLPVDAALPVLEFKEIWGYLIAGRESSLLRNLPITDIAYFSAAVSAYGKLIEIPNRARIPSHFTGRVHLSVVCNGYGLSHFVLKPGTPERRDLIADLIAATSDYDGLNIDMENVPVLDGANFASFLRELRAGLPREKMLSVCVPARTRRLQNDAYHYDVLTPIVDRVFVMAYDEHWSGSNPGSVASMDWCRRVAEYSLNVIGRDKLVMGLPFYGRAWGDYNASRALVHSSVQNLIREHGIDEVTYENGIPTITYSKNISVRVYFENEYSLVNRMNMYKNAGVNSVGFWRLGQETTAVWNYLRIGSSNTTAAARPPANTSSSSTTAAFTGRYTVQRGDSLWTLARRYGVSIHSLAEANGMTINDTLHIGRVLRVPAR